MYGFFGDVWLPAFFFLRGLSGEAGWDSRLARF